MKILRFQINDDPWNIYLCNPEDLASIYSSDDGINDIDVHGYTDFKKKEIYVSNDELSLQLVRHEFMHAAFSYLCLGDTSLDVSNLEEIMCDFVEYRLDWLKDKTDNLYKQLVNLKEAKEDQCPQ